jgi:hypothetical protein
MKNISCFLVQKIVIFNFKKIVNYFIFYRQHPALQNKKYNLHFSFSGSWLPFWIRILMRNTDSCTQGVTKRCRLSWLTNSALDMSPHAGGVGMRCLSHECSCAHGAYRLWRPNSIFNLWLHITTPWRLS